MNKELIPHLFRTEYSKITAVLCKHFGLDQIEIAEDIASDTFLAALNYWTYKGVPENPTGWLYAVAKNKAKNILARRKTFDQLSAALQQDSIHEKFNDEIDLSEGNITDSQLQMLFAICHPLLPTEAQIGLALRTLCGFGIDEIASAFLTNRETINKRLHRAREKLRSENIKLEFPADNLRSRLDTVLTTLYLLFNEGYYSESNESVIREDLCIEAMRLTNLLLENPSTNLPMVNALLALMCFHASRLRARKDLAGTLVLYEDQDENLWDKALITKGVEFLFKSSQGSSISRYHLEAHIAYWHTRKDDERRWRQILHLYNHLLALEYSPIAALNRAYAVSKVMGIETAIKEAEKLKLLDNHYYFTLLGEFYKASNLVLANQHFHKALLLAKTLADRKIIEQKILEVERSIAAN